MRVMSYYPGVRSRSELDRGSGEYDESFGRSDDRHHPRQYSRCFEIRLGLDDHDHPTWIEGSIDERMVYGSKDDR